jgi:hypothetical protein
VSARSPIATLARAFDVAIVVLLVGGGLAMLYSLFY